MITPGDGKRKHSTNEFSSHLESLLNFLVRREAAGQDSLYRSSRLPLIPLLVPARIIGTIIAGTVEIECSDKANIAQA